MFLRCNTVSFGGIASRYGFRQPARKKVSDGPIRKRYWNMSLLGHISLMIYCFGNLTSALFNDANNGCEYESNVQEEAAELADLG